MKQFIHHADQNELLPVRQSAYRRFHSTESAVLVVHNDIVHRCDSFTRPQLSFRLCWPLHSTVNPTIQVLRHRAATGVVPFIPNWTYAGVYHPLSPNSSNIAHIRCAIRLESWSGTIYLIHQLYHVNKIASACFYHIRRLRQIRQHVSREVLKQLVTSLVLSRLDYCNAILAGLRASTLMPLQLTQNAAARLVLGLDRRSSITTALRDLYWLPVKHRITFKVATLMHQALHCRCPAYLADLVAFSSTNSHRHLRSTTTRAAAIQRTQTQFERRAFSVCGPDVWNSLPPSIRTVDSNSSFRRALKYLFQLAFNN